jgi:hypothetical protein
MSSHTLDDIVIASKKKSTQINDLAEIFTNLHGAQLKLNPEKCVFGCREERSYDVLGVYKRNRGQP